MIDADPVDDLALHEVECLHLERRRTKIRMPFEKLFHGFISCMIHAGNGDVRMVNPLFRFNPDIEKGVFDAFVKLK